MHFESQKVFRFQQLRQHHLSVVGAIGRVVSAAAVIVVKVNESGVFDAVAFGRAEGKDQAFGQLVIGRVLDFVVRFRQHDDSLHQRCEFVVMGSVFPKRSLQTRFELIERKLLGQLRQNFVGERSSQVPTQSVCVETDRFRNTNQGRSVVS